MCRPERATSVVAVGALLLLAAGCAINPATGKRQLSLVSESQEVQMGRDSDRAVTAEMGLYGGEALQDYVQGVGDRLAARSERPSLDWTFRVVDDSAVNAFALPGGFIYITRGIMANLNSEAELATVMGHEIGHVTARHSVNQISKAQLAQLGLGLGTVLSPEFAQYGQFAEMGLGLMFLKFGRDDERQADDLGLRYMVAAGYDPRPAPGVFDMLARVSAASGSERVPGWLSTHPAPENRRDTLEREVSAQGRDFSQAKIGTQEYLAHVDGMVYGADPREGYFEDQRFFHPGMEFRFDFPPGWKTINTREAVLGSAPERDAIVRVTLATQATPEGALDAFFKQDGIQRGSSWRTSVGGAPAASRYFAASTSKGTVRGIAAFVQHGDRVLTLLGYTVDTNWPTHGKAIEASLGSFQRLTDPAALAVEPARIAIVDLDRSVTLEEFAKQTRATVPVETLALLNRVEPNARLVAGRPYKTVRGGRRP